MRVPVALRWGWRTVRSLKVRWFKGVPEASYVARHHLLVFEMAKAATIPDHFRLAGCRWQFVNKNEYTTCVIVVYSRATKPPVCEDS